MYSEWYVHRESISALIKIHRFEVDTALDFSKKTANFHQIIRFPWSRITATPPPRQILGIPKLFLYTLHRPNVFQIDVILHTKSFLNLINKEIWGIFHLFSILIFRPPFPRIYTIFIRFIIPSMLLFFKYDASWNDNELLKLSWGSIWYWIYFSLLCRSKRLTNYSYWKIPV